MIDTGTFAVVTGGGTSGHVLPALAIADALAAAGHPPSAVHYVGTRRGVETRLVPLTQYPHTFLDVVGLQRSLSRRNLAVLPKLLRANRAAKRLLHHLRPQVVVNVGGYGSFPATWAARRAGVPYIVVSYDRRPGVVSRLFARGAATCAVAFPGSTLPHAELTGAPVRQAMIHLDRQAGRAAARAELDLPEGRFVVAVMCGSQGAATVNTVIAQLVELAAGRRDLAVYHVVGERFLADAMPARDGSAGILYRVIGYEDRMPQLYAAADLLVSRAGAGTIAELSTIGVPAVVVPWPGAAENHQVDNAKVLTEHGAAILVEQQDLHATDLLARIDRFIADPTLLAELAQRARDSGALHRSGRLVEVIERVAAGGSVR